MATVNIESTQLDFKQIKNNLKTYLAAQTEFSDFDFEGAGINNILDVLAYNTHFNALNANFALNEAFLNTAQLRSSVVSHAQSLGYQVRSRTAAGATVNISLNLSGVSNRNTTYTLASGTKFSASVDDISYTYQTLENCTATDDGTGFYSFVNSLGSPSIVIKEGSLKTKTFYVGETSERQLYVIPDLTIDTSTAVVKVYNSPSATAFASYVDIAKAVRVVSTSRFYQLAETPNGFYELNFGDGVSFGQSPSTGNVVTVEYLSCVGEIANGGEVFTPNAKFSVNGTGFDLTVTTAAAATGGDKRQTIESIRQNAPIAFAAQQRLVTAEDYKAIILENYSNIQDAIAWGGEDNVPANYGNVYVGLKFANGTTEEQKTATKDAIVQNLTNFLSVLSIDTVFVDPIETFIEAITVFNFDPNLTNVTQASTESSVFSNMKTYFADNLGVFGGIFRRSSMLNGVDDISDAVLSSRVDIKVQQRFQPTLNQSLSYVINFPITIAAPDDVTTIITSSTFRLDNKVCLIKNQLNKNKLIITDTLGNVIRDNVGEYDPAAGRIELNGFAPTAITSGTSFLKISAKPADESVIRPLRNYIIQLDEDASFASGQVDRQTVNVTL
jgi:hypothetical protein